LLSAASIAPAPSPYGTANTKSIQNFVEKEKPNNATTVRKTLITVTTFVESFLVSLSEKRLDTIVPPEIIIVTIPIYDVATPMSACMTGQPDPKSESGRPRLMNAR